MNKKYYIRYSGSYNPPKLDFSKDKIISRKFKYSCGKNIFLIESYLTGKSLDEILNICTTYLVDEDYEYVLEMIDDYKRIQRNDKIKILLNE